MKFILIKKESLSQNITLNMLQKSFSKLQNYVNRNINVKGNSFSKLLQVEIKMFKIKDLNIYFTIAQVSDFAY